MPFSARFLLGSEYQAMTALNPHYREVAFQITRNRMLYSGRVDVVASDMRIFGYFNREVDTQVDVTQPLTLYPIFAATDYKLGCREQHYCDRFNHGLAAIRRIGEYTRIERRYAMY
jgi:polar amino acid transport system substrate-binding protein